MAITPVDLLKSIKEEDAPTIKRLETVIDDELKKLVANNHVATIDLVVINEGKTPRMSVVNELIRMYGDAGWKVEVNQGSEPREGAWLRLTFLAKTGAES